MKKKKSILITGCSSGIGFDTAMALHQNSWEVYATCKKLVDCTILCEKGLNSFPLDLSDSNSINRAVKKVEQKSGGKLDALFNNGAFAIPGSIEDIPRDAFREIFEVNVFGQLELLSKCLPLIRANNGGKVINCSSVLGFTAMPFRGAYIGTKFAMEGITDTIRRENVDPNIQFILIEPGPINTRIRLNSRKHYERWINTENSAYKAVYKNHLERRLYEEAPKNFFELEPEAVTKKVIKILESKRPKARYYVTIPTFFAAIINRIFGSKIQDFIFKYRFPRS